MIADHNAADSKELMARRTENGGSRMSAPTTPKPSPCNVRPENIPPEMKSRAQWVCWRYTWKPATENRAGKWDKPPIDARTGKSASSTDPETWSTFDDAWAAYCDPQNGYDGIGYVFSGDEDDFVGVDLDDCRDSQSAQMRPWTPEQRKCEHWAEDAPEPQQFIDALPSYAEVSPSQVGVKLIVRACIAKGMKHGSVEMYRVGRYFTVTGHRLEGAPTQVVDCGAALAAIYVKFDAKTEAIKNVRSRPNKSETSESSRPDRTSTDVIPTLHQVLAACENAANGDKFRRLFGGDSSGYPSQSEAELALCGVVAFWSAGQASVVDAVFRQSKLFRDKWDQKRGQQTYGERTVSAALDQCSNFYDWSKGEQGPKSTFSIGDVTLILKCVRSTPTKVVARLEVRKSDKAIDLFEVTSAVSNRATALERIQGHLDDPFEFSDAEVDALLGAILVEAGRAQKHKPSGRTIYQILAEHVPSAVGFSYRTRKGTAYSKALSREFNRASFVEHFLTNAIIELVIGAADAPVDDSGEVSRTRLISLIEQELKVLWGELTGPLPRIEKANLDETSPEGREFCQTIISAWHKPCQMGIHRRSLNDKESVQLATTNSLVSRVLRQAKEGSGRSNQWVPIHEAYGAYCRLYVNPSNGEEVTLLAMRFELLKQTGFVIPEVTDQTSFRDLGEKFGAIDPKPPVCDSMNRGKLRLAVLTSALADRILAEPLVNVPPSPVDP